MILRRYLLDNDVLPKMEALERPDKTFSDDFEPLKAGFDHERYVTSLINECYKTAYDIHDFRTMKMLDWFVEEQGEEEVNASDMISDYELFAGTPEGLYNLDAKYQARTYTQQTTMPM